MKSGLTKLIPAVLAVVSLTGCASGANQAYQAAHDAASKRGVAEAASRAEIEKTKYLALASAAKACTTGECALGMALAMTAIGSRSEAASSAAPAIAPPTNEFLDGFKAVAQTALGLYGIRVNGAISLVNATRGAANSDAAAAGLNALDVYRSDTVNK